MLTSPNLPTLASPRYGGRVDEGRAVLAKAAGTAPKEQFCGEPCPSGFTPVLPRELRYRFVKSCRPKYLNNINEISGAPDTIRTCDLCLRRAMLV